MQAGPPTKMLQSVSDMLAEVKAVTGPEDKCQLGLRQVSTSRTTKWKVHCDVHGDSPLFAKQRLAIKAAHKHSAKGRPWDLS